MGGDWPRSVVRGVKKIEPKRKNRLIYYIEDMRPVEEFVAERALKK